MGTDELVITESDMKLVCFAAGMSTTKVEVMEAIYRISSALSEVRLADGDKVCIALQPDDSPVPNSVMEIIRGNN